MNKIHFSCGNFRVHTNSLCLPSVEKHLTEIVILILQKNNKMYRAHILPELGSQEELCQLHSRELEICLVMQELKAHESLCYMVVRPHGESLIPAEPSNGSLQRFGVTWKIKLQESVCLYLWIHSNGLPTWPKSRNGSTSGIPGG